MLRRLFIISCLLIVFDLALLAQVDTLVVPQVDTVAASDTVELSDEEIMKLLSSPQTDTVKKVVDRGRDVSGMVNARRQRTADITPFSARPLLANTFVSARYTTNKILTEDYGFGLIGGLSFGKWVHEDHAVRLSGSFGQWQDNFDGSPIKSIDASLSYLFNLSSYVGGYRTNRLAEVMIVAGAGYTNSIHYDKFSHAANAHAGVNLNLRLFNGMDFFIEPLVKIYTNGMAVSYAGNWRTWLASVETSFGLSYNIKQSKTPPRKSIIPLPIGWFVSLQGGPHFQNSAIVYNILGLEKSLGVHLSLGIGKYYNSFFAMRYSASYSRGPWVIYETEKFPCNYFAARAEAMIDFVGMVRSAIGKDGKSMFSLSALLGPEFGYLHKVDMKVEMSEYEHVVRSAYVGVTGGLQAKFRVTDRLSLYLEPRFSLMPYDAPLHDLTTQSDYRNYYDGIFNGNLGIEFML